MRNVVQLCLVTNNILPRFSPSCDRSCVEMAERFASRRYSLKNKLGDRMMKQLVYGTRFSQNIVICQCLADQFAQPRPIIVNCFLDVPTVVVVVVAHFPGREGGVLNRDLTKEASPRGLNPYPFIYHF